MNYKLHKSEEDEDAAFRARLAPLASEVLPRPSAARTQPSTPSRDYHKVIVLTASVSAVMALGVGLLFVERPWTNPNNTARVVAGSAVVNARSGDIAPPQSTPGEMKAIQEDARAAAPGDVVTASLPAPTPAGYDRMVGLLLQRAGLALSDGDIIGARLLFERAAAMGSASAATAAGKTYDIDFLLRNGAHGIQADQNSAAAWFRKGAALGDPEARTQLARLTAQKLP